MADLKTTVISLPHRGVRVTLRAFEIERYPFSIDQHHAAGDQLLPGAIVLGVATKRSQRNDELYRCSCRVTRLMHGGAEINPIKLGLAGEILGNRPQQVRN